MDGEIDCPDHKGNSLSCIECAHEEAKLIVDLRIPTNPFRDSTGTRELLRRLARAYVKLYALHDDALQAGIERGEWD